MRKAVTVAAVSILLAGSIAVVVAVLASDDTTGVRRAFTRRAVQVVDAWREAAYAAGHPTRLQLLDTPLVRPVGGFPDDATEHAFTTGAFILAPGADLSDQPPSPDIPARAIGTFSRTIDYATNATLRVPLISAQAAYAAMRHHRSPSCTPGSAACLFVFGAGLAIQAVRTTDGPAIVPSWEITIATAPGGTGWLTSASWIAVDPAALAPLPTPTVPGPPAELPLTAIASVHTQPAPHAIARAIDPAVVAAAVGAAAATHLAITPDNHTCPARRPHPVVYESPDAVVVAIQDTEPHAPCPPTTQPPHPFTVTLTSPLRYRILLDAATGQPIPLGDR
jgi:hypothetical protein